MLAIPASPSPLIKGGVVGSLLQHEIMRITVPCYVSVQGPQIKSKSIELWNHVAIGSETCDRHSKNKRKKTASSIYGQFVTCVHTFLRFSQMFPLFSFCFFFFNRRSPRCRLLSFGYMIPRVRVFDILLLLSTSPLSISYVFYLFQ